MAVAIGSAAAAAADRISLPHADPTARTASMERTAEGRMEQAFERGIWTEACRWHGDRRRLQRAARPGSPSRALRLDSTGTRPRRSPFAALTVVCCLPNCSFSLATPTSPTPSSHNGFRDGRPRQTHHPQSDTRSHARSSVRSMAIALARQPAFDIQHVYLPLTLCCDCSRRFAVGR